jgi:hypothetical protein
MLLADVLFLAIVVYLGYRFIFNFLLPIVRTTHHVRKQFRENFGEPGSSNPANAAKPTSGDGARRSYKPPAEDYIEFEEVK